MWASLFEGLPIITIEVNKGYSEIGDLVLTLTGRNKSTGRYYIKFWLGNFFKKSIIWIAWEFIE